MCLETTKLFEYGKCLEKTKEAKSLGHFLYSRDFVVFPFSRHFPYPREFHLLLFQYTFRTHQRMLFPFFMFPKLSDFRCFATKMYNNVNCRLQKRAKINFADEVRQQYVYVELQDQWNGPYFFS